MSEAYSSQRLIVSDAETKCVLDSFGKENPFFTFEFVRAMNALGREIWVIRSRVEASSGDIALGFIKRGRLSVELEFVSLPPLAARSEFWDAVMAFCKSMGVTDIVASTFGSAEFELPAIRRDRTMASSRVCTVPARSRSSVFAVFQPQTEC